MKTTHKVLQNFIVISYVLVSIIGLKAQNMDTIYPLQEIHPFEITGNPSVNLPLTAPTALGDINNDGYTDFVTNDYTPDERTEDPNDFVRKTLIITDIDHPDEAIVIYNSNIQGIKDFNGDGFDDMLNFISKAIYFGGPEGISQDSLVVEFSDEYEHLYYAGDITGDGKSEFFIGSRYINYLMVFFGGETEPIIFEPSFGLFSDQPGKFLFYDYDNDGQKELAIIRKVLSEIEVGWYAIDTIEPSINSEMERNIVIDGIFSDLNGDNHPDIVAPEYMSGLLNLRVHFGKAEYPYFESSTTILLEHNSPILHAGDINNDGCDDWYSKCHKDTLIFFMGNENIAESGVNIEKYFTGSINLMMPPAFNVQIFGILQTRPVLYYDNDSIADLLLSYWLLDSNLQYEEVGSAIITGNNSPDIQNPQLMVQPIEQSYEELGYGKKVRNIGDINKDGYHDFGILANQGCYLNIHYGSADLNTTPDLEIRLPQDGRNNALDWDAGDINNDGITDFIVANSSAFRVFFNLQNMLNYQNRVFVFLGKEDQGSALNYLDADFVLHDTSTFNIFGKNIRIIGDYNADGYNDFIVGGGKHRDCLREAFLYFGGEQISEQPDMVLSVYCNECGIAFADPIIKSGDINADGYDDFILSDPDNDNGLYHIYYGGPEADSIPDMIIANPDFDESNFDQCASALCNDYNGDTYPDFMSYSTDTIYLYYGGPGLDSIHDEIFCDTSINNSVSFIEFLPDFSEQGKSDILIGDYYSERMLIFEAGDSSHNQADVILKNEVNWATNASTGDFNKDGFTELLIGFPQERNYGIVDGGIVKIYQSPVYTGSEEFFVKGNKSFVYPNPTNQYINVFTPGPDCRELLIGLYSIQGRKILESRQKRLNLKNLPKGLYLLRITGRGISPETHKILVY